MSSTSSTSDVSSGESMDDPRVARRGRGRKRGVSRGESRDTSRGGRRGSRVSNRGGGRGRQRGVSRGESRDTSRGGRRGSRVSNRGGRRGRQRGGGRSAGSSRGLSGDVTDKQRVEEMWEQRKSQMKNVVASLTRDSLNSLVLKLIDREPGLVFDLCETMEGTQPPGPSSAPSWCRCGNCQPMPTIMESKCCGCLPQNCISTRDKMERLILDPEVLVLGQRYYREMLGRHRQRVEDANKMYRNSAYRNFTLWRHGRLGAGSRRVIPSCCVNKIRATFPSATGQYTGFLPSRFM